MIYKSTYWGEFKESTLENVQKKSMQMKKYIGYFHKLTSFMLSLNKVFLFLPASDISIKKNTIFF